VIFHQLKAVRNMSEIGNRKTLIESIDELMCEGSSLYNSTPNNDD